MAIFIIFEGKTVIMVPQIFDCNNLILCIILYSILSETLTFNSRIKRVANTFCAVKMIIEIELYWNAWKCASMKNGGKCFLYYKNDYWNRIVLDCTKVNFNEKSVEKVQRKINLIGIEKEVVFNTSNKTYFCLILWKSSI